MDVGNLNAIFTLDSTDFSAGLRKVERETAATTSKVESLSREMSRGLIPQMAKSTAMITAFGAATVATTLKLADMISQVESINRLLKHVAGSAEEATKMFDFLDRESIRLGMSLDVAIRTFTQLSVSAAHTSLNVDEIKEIFLAVAEAGAALGMSNHRLELSFLALQQMISKGVISMQELRQQLGENLPGAMQIMAKSLGITMAQLDELVSTGQLLSDHVLPHFADALREEFAGAIVDIESDVRVALSGLSSQWFKFKQAMTDGVVEAALRRMIELFTKLLEIGTKAIKVIDSLWRILSRPIGQTFAWEFEKGLEESAEKSKKAVREMSEEMSRAIDQVKLKDKMSESVEGMERTLKEKYTSVISTAKGVLGDFASGLNDFVMGADFSVRKLFDGIARRILQFTTELLVLKPIIEWFKASLGIGGLMQMGGGGMGGMAGGSLGPITAMAGGGIINEPVLGVGLGSGSRYLLGESGPETVSPMGGSAKSINLTINALDSKSVTELLRNNPQAVTSPLVEALNNGDRGVTASLRRSLM